MNDRPRSRKPESWPTKIVDLLLSACKGETLIPFENGERVRAFRKCYVDIRRSFREHGHRHADIINSLEFKEFSTADMMAAREHYHPDNPDHFPLTVCISPVLGFLPNLDNVVVNRETAPLPPPGPNLAEFDLDLELLNIAKDFEDDDTQAVADIFRPRVRRNSGDGDA